MPSPKNDKNLSFEKALQQLEQTVSQLESGNLNLEEALLSYERGVSFAKQCEEHLQTARKKIEILKGDQKIPWSEDGES